MPSQTGRDCERLKIGAPHVTRLFNQHGRVDRRTVLRAATTGIIGTILGGKSVNAAGLFSRLMGEATPIVPAASAAESNALRLATLGDYVWLTPTKPGGGAQVQDLATGKTMAWIEYWNYGDSCPIAHHLAAFPSVDPRIGFEYAGRPECADLWHSLPDPRARHV
jgi:thiocyanate desulfurase